MPYCMKCGTEIPEGNKFCGSCGTPIGGLNTEVTSAPVVQATTTDTAKNINNKNLKPCKKCGQMVAKDAKTCPHCGAKLKSSPLAVILIVLGIIIFISAVSSCGNKSNKSTSTSSNTTTSISESAPETKTVTVEPVTKERYGIGEAVTLNDVVVTLKSAYESNGTQFLEPQSGNIYVICEFEIENNSKSDINVSSLLSFEAYCDDYSITESISALASETSKGQLDGAVAAGKKMNGVIGYEVPADWQELEISFTPSFWNGKDITFVVTK